MGQLIYILGDLVHFLEERDVVLEVVDEGFFWFQVVEIALPDPTEEVVLVEVERMFQLFDFFFLLTVEDSLELLVDFLKEVMLL